MLSPIVVGTIIYASLLIILCIGFSLTHLMEKFPNFSHASYAIIGTIISYMMVRIWGYNPYLSVPLSSLVGGVLGITLYLLVVRPMQERGRGGIELTFALFALSITLLSLANVFSYWVLISYGVTTGGFLLSDYDFTFLEYPGVLFVAPLVSIALVTVLHLLLTRTRFGIAIRASAEDPRLAVALGINIFRVHVSSWFLTGAMAGLAGALLPLWIPINLNGSDALLISIMAGSILGGLDNIYGAIVGGIVMALAQRVLPGFLIQVLGMWIAGYDPLVPILFIVVVLMIEPRGLTGIFYEEHPRLERLRRAVFHSRSND